MANSVTPDGIAVGNRVENFGSRKLHARVVDNVLSARTYWSRLQGNGQAFLGNTQDFTIKITDSAAGEFYSGLETLNSARSDTTITLSYAHTAFAQPIVLSLLESSANAGAIDRIDLDAFKVDEAVAEAIVALGTAAYGTGSGKQFLGLEGIVDDGTNNSTIGGQNRTTYSALNATVTATGGTLSLSKLATLEDAVSAAGIESEEPNINVTTKAVWSNYEELLSPQVRASYASVGYDSLPIRGQGIMKRADLKGAAGFTALTYRGKPVIKDDAATSGVWYMLNERYLMWKGRPSVGSKFSKEVSKVSLGTPRTIEGVAAAPSENHGWFFQDFQMMPNQAGMIARYHIIGQICATQPRRNGKLTGILGV